MSSSVSLSIIFVDEASGNLVSKIWGSFKSSGESNDFLKEMNSYEIYAKCLKISSFRFQIYFEEYMDVFEYYWGREILRGVFRTSSNI